MMIRTKDEQDFICTDHPELGPLEERTAADHLREAHPALWRMASRAQVVALTRHSEQGGGHRYLDAWGQVRHQAQPMDCIWCDRRLATRGGVLCDRCRRDPMVALISRRGSLGGHGDE